MTIKKRMLKEIMLGGLFASILLGGAILAECTQIDAATKLASYYQRYTEIRKQILNFENWVKETQSAISGFVPNLKNNLGILEDQITGDIDAYLKNVASKYGLGERAAGIAGQEDLLEYVGRNVLGSNDACIASAMGLGRDVDPIHRIVPSCTEIDNRMVIPYGDGLAPSASVSLNGMLATSQGSWPANNVIREDLSWLRDKVGTKGGLNDWLLKAEVAPNSDDVASSIADQMRLGDLVTGRGLSNIPTPTGASPSELSVGLQASTAAAGRNAYAIEAVAREASVRPQLEALRQQLSSISIENLDSMTEGQRYATRVSVLSTKETLKALLNESRLRQEQLEGILLSIDQAEGLTEVGMYQ